METKDLVKETAVIDMLCDGCQSEVKAGSHYYMDEEKGQVLCEGCVGK